MRSSQVLLGLVLTSGVAFANTAGNQGLPQVDQDMAIIGGTRTTVGAYPTVVAITAGGGICTGTLVAKDWILTAAHCIDPEVLGLSNQAAVTSSVRVYYNTVDINTTAGRANVRRATNTFPKLTFNVNALGANDVGLIKLAEPITGITPTPINFNPAMAPVGIMVTMVGFGATAQGGGGSVGIQFELKDRTSVSCQSLGGGSNANLLCFNQTDAKGKCSGDSGGPSFAMINGAQTVVGITSFGDQNCQSFGADTRTDIEKDFIQQTAPELKGSCKGDEECNGGVCFQMQCIAQPFAGNGLGVDCIAPAACESGICLAGPGGMKCSMTCNPTMTDSCPDGFDCLDGGGGAGACWPSSGPGGDDDSGCCDSSGRGGPTALFAIGLMALVMRRRRR